MTTKSDNPGARRRRWVYLALLAAGTVLVVFLLAHRWRQAGFKWHTFAASFLELKWPWIVGALLLAYLSYLGRAMRWSVMITPLRPNASLWQLWKATAIGFTAVVLLGRPGEFVRPYLISRKLGVPFTSQLAAWLLERIWDLLAVLVIFGCALTQIADSRAELGPRFEWVLQLGGYVVAAAGLLCVALLIFLGRYSDVARKRLLAALSFLREHHQRRADRVVSAFVDGARATQSRKNLVLLVSYTIAEWVVILLCIACILWSYPATSAFGFRDVLIFTGFLAFGSLVQIPGIGGGVQIVSIIILNELFGVPLEIAAGIAIMIWIMTFVVIVPAGLGLAFHEGLNWRQFKALEVEAARRAEAAEASGNGNGQQGADREDPPACAASLQAGDLDR